MTDLTALFHGLADPGADGWSAYAVAFIQVVLIDLVLAGDNAVAVGLVASNLPLAERRKVILWGLLGAVVLRIGFALVTVRLLQIIGLLLAGGILLLGVCWRTWRELSDSEHRERARASLALVRDPGAAASPEASTVAGVQSTHSKPFWSALIQVMVADLAMSLDNVLAVAGAARAHPAVLVAGLLLSVALMGVAATVIAKLLHRWRWIASVGLLIILVVALRMIWEGGRQVLESGMLDPWLDQMAAHCACRKS